MFARSFKVDDPYNYLGKRSVSNTDKETYNCGGYAFGMFSWYHPYP